MERLLKVVEDEENYYDLLGCDEQSTVSICRFNIIIYKKHKALYWFSVRPAPDVDLTTIIESMLIDR